MKLCHLVIFYNNKLISTLKSDLIIQFKFAKMAFTYSVDKESSSPDWIVTFDQYSEVRVYEGESLAYGYFEVLAGNQIRVKPNQYLKALVNGAWSYLSDADNR